MKCPQCQTENMPGEDYCVNCGSDLMDIGSTAGSEGLGDRILTESIMTLNPPEPLTINSEALIFDAVELMRQNKFGSVLITDGDTLKGIFTERDFLKRVLNKGLDINSVKISEVMTRKTQSLQTTDSIAYALNMMSVHGIRHIPLLDNEKPVGFVSVRGMLKYLGAQTL